ncbi:EAL domain-containing protein [Microbacterium terricola]|uniref:EAL domain-containing protein n=1 Tax=Microbacterium terricola TaxID=344163 RepID=A0ABM8DVE5_9MICO|nr:EAL domain-containing protein [Microbacterium terricola]UYK39666.1 EAL domain-containing protein [Microbacterium terricola]BDV29592.1 hypothetical protein Microterr_02520 [Microbacterium terricola]
MIDIDDLAADLADAIRERDVFAAYQPQISLDTGRPVAVEVLCRWQHPVIGTISPETFISVAEQTGQIHTLGALMLGEALDAAAGWRAAGSDIQVAVNVSPLQIAEPAFLTHLEGELRRRELDSSALILEITESLPLVGSRAVIDLLRAIRTHGVGLSLDDFGTGHASLEQLESLPLSEVKLDGSLIRDGDAHTDAAVREVMTVARERGVRIVAEGIETPAHLARVVELRCDRAQGYFICRPRPKADIDRLLERGSEVAQGFLIV